MDSHDAKLEELENLVKGQASLIDELKSKQVELTSALESKQVQLESALNDSKVQAAKELSDVKVALEQSQEQAKVSLAQKLDRLTEMGEEHQVGLAKHLKQLQIQITADQDYSRTSLINATGRQNFRY